MQLKRRKNDPAHFEKLSFGAQPASASHRPRSKHSRPVAQLSIFAYDVAVLLQTPVGQFGNKFRKAREAKKLSLDDVSNVTKISSRMLQAIEDEHFDLLPGGVFNKGFIRAYAKHLGLNDEDAVNDYLACLRQAQIDAAETREPANAIPSGAPAKKGPSTYVKPELKKQAQVEVEDKDEELPDLQLPRAEHVRKPPREFLVPERSFPWKPLLALCAVVVVAASLWIRHTRNRTSVAVSSPAVATPQTPAPVVQPASVAVSQTTPSKLAPTTPETSETSSAQPTSAPQPKLNEVSSNPSAERSEKTTSKNGTEATTPATSTKATMPAKAAPKMTLVIRATETSWISVTADGQLVSQETLIGPANVTIHAGQQITARVGNAAGVAFVWNGQDIPAQGAEGEVKTVTFDQSGMHAGPPPSITQAP